LQFHQAVNFRAQPIRILGTLTLLLALLAPLRVEARPGWLSRMGQGLRSAAGHVGDRLVHLRGFERSMARAERLYERGDYRRTLGILRRSLNSKGLSPTDQARVLLYVGTVRTALGDHTQAMRAFAGLAHRRPDFALPPGVNEDVAINFNWGQHVNNMARMRGEMMSAEPSPYNRTTLLNRLRWARFRAKAWGQDTIAKSPALMKAWASTVGRINVWRAKNTLQQYAVPNFKVVLEPDNKDPTSGAYAKPDGVVHLDRSTTLNYGRTLRALAHESYHLTNSISYTPEWEKEVMSWDRHQQKAQVIKEAGRSLSKHTPQGRALRSSLAKKLDRVRKQRHGPLRRLHGMHLKEEGQAEAFAGYVMGGQNMPVTDAAWNIYNKRPDRLHPHPRQMTRHFLDGVDRAIGDSLGAGKDWGTAQTAPAGQNGR
jgi:hypothetical protein